MALSVLSVDVTQDDRIVDDLDFDPDNSFMFAAVIDTEGAKLLSLFMVNHQNSNIELVYKKGYAMTIPADRTILSDGLNFAMMQKNDVSEMGATIFVNWNALKENIFRFDEDVSESSDLYST